MGEMRIENLSENLNGKYHFGDMNVDGRIILKWILKKHDVNWINLIQDRVQLLVLANTGNGPSGPAERGEFED
jgi:hypothetical protein